MAERFLLLLLLLLVCCTTDLITVKAKNGNQDEADIPLDLDKKDSGDYDAEERRFQSQENRESNHDCHEQIKQTHGRQIYLNEDLQKLKVCPRHRDDDALLDEWKSEEGVKREKREVKGVLDDINEERTGTVKEEKARTNEKVSHSNNEHYPERRAEMHEDDISNSENLRSKDASTNAGLGANSRMSLVKDGVTVNEYSPHQAPDEKRNDSFEVKTDEERKNSGFNETDEGRHDSETPPFPPAGHLKKLGEHKQAEADNPVEVLHYVPNGKDFYTHFIRKRRPLLMKGAAKHWGAVKNWRNETYLKEKYGGVIFDVEYRKFQSAAEYPIKKTMNMTEFLSLYKNIPMYLDSPFPQSNLTQDIVIPYCMQCEEIFSTISSVHLLFSSGGTSSAFHQDGYDNLLTVISGRKEVLVFDSMYSKELYADDFETVPGLSPVNPEAVDLIKFPMVAEVPFHKVILYPGDILFIPMHWWHHVRSYESPNIGITLWFFQFPADDIQAEDNEYVPYMSVVDEGRRFDRLVEQYPHTIECKSQNPSLGSLFSTAGR